MIIPRFEIKRVHGYKTFRVWDNKTKDWEGPAMYSRSEASDHLFEMVEHFKKLGQATMIQVSRQH